MDDRWEHPPETISLGPDEVHVWRAFLEPRASLVDGLSALLSTEEQAAAARFRLPKARIAFVLRRALLRQVLSRYLGEAPGQLVFTKNAWGKPAVQSSDGGEALHFNASQSAGMALLAVSRAAAVGIDVELRRADFGYRSIAARFFSAAEVAFLESLPEGGRLAAFFSLWTCKEACLKALGRGLSIPLSAIEIALDADGPRVAASRGSREEASRFDLSGLTPDAEYAGALAVLDVVRPLRRRQFTYFDLT